MPPAKAGTPRPEQEKEEAPLPAVLPTEADGSEQSLSSRSHLRLALELFDPLHYLGPVSTAFSVNSSTRALSTLNCVFLAVDRA